MNLAYSESGNPNARPLVLIHAFPLNRAMWKHQLDGLSNCAHLIAPDTPGFGESPTLSEGPTMAAYVSAIAGFLDRMKIEKAVFAGCSMGGYILFELLRSYPDRVEGLILCDTRAEADASDARETRMQAIQIVREYGLAPVAQGMIPKLLCPNTLESNPDLVSEIESAILSNQPEGIIHAQQAMSDRTDSVQTLHSIGIPTLILVGESDELTPPDLARSMHEMIRGSRLEILPKAGHLSPLEQPQAANTAIRTFLDL